ncbi:MAG: biopolymer transporter ExbD [Ichthyobacteriaceae bacterium]|nr:biopolymer transporter ExbD [Ichthyobacteriaceae bacterium]
MAKREVPEVNAGSMADIAFMLLIFFLVTTTMDVDTGIMRKLPPMPEKVDPNIKPPPIREKNLFEVVANANDQLLVEGNLMKVKDLREATKEFLNNNGDGTCTYCTGVKNQRSSDNPQKAIITVQNDRGTSYNLYIKVQNELVAAINELREDLAIRKYGVPLDELDEDRQKKIQKMYPQKISEAEPVDLQ